MAEITKSGRALLQAAALFAMVVDGIYSAKKM